MIPQDLHYLFPEAVYLVLVILLFLLLYFAYFIYKRENGQHFLGSQSDDHGQHFRYYWLCVSLICAVWFFACIALMQPVGSAHFVKNLEGHIVKMRAPHEVIFVVDSSASMGAKDGRNGVSRLDEAREIVDQVISRLQGQQASLYAFTSQVVQLSPKTHDLQFVRMMSQEMGVNEGGGSGTDFQALIAFLNQDIANKNLAKTIVLISDGGDLIIEPLAGKKRKQSIEELSKRLSLDRQTNVVVIGVGTQEGAMVPNFDGVSKLNEDLLNSLSLEANGKYYLSREFSVTDIAEAIVRDFVRQDQPLVSVQDKASAVVYEQYYQYPLAVAILGLMILFLLPRGSWSVLLCLFGALPLSADQLEEAKIWLEAGINSKAIEIYQEMLKGSPKPYQESVIRYNLGTAYLEDGQYQKAIDTFRTIPLQQNSPLVLSRLNTNTIASRLRQEIEEKDLPKRIFLLREAMRGIFEGKSYNCTLDEIIQAPKCETALNLKEMRAFIENDLSTALTDIQNYQIQNANFIEGVPLLLSYGRAMQDNIRFLEDKAGGATLQESYHNLFVDVAESWAPLWTKLRQRTGVTQEFLNAYQYNRYALILFKNNNYKEAREHFESMSELLLILMRQQGVSSLAKEEIIQLSRSYQLALLQEPVQEVTLRALAEEQRRINEFNLQKAKRSLAKAIELTTIGELEGARIFVLIGQEIVRQIIRNEIIDKTPQTILEGVIESQQHALAIARLMEQVGPALWQPQLQAAQESVLETASPFYEAVIAAQKEQYQKLGMCQEVPWETVVPLFYEGVLAARTAVKEQEKIEWQEEALAKWRNALRDLKEVKSTKKKEQLLENVKAIRNLKEMQINDVRLKQPRVKNEGSAW